METLLKTCVYIYIYIYIYGVYCKLNNDKENNKNVTKRLLCRRVFKAGRWANVKKQKYSD